MQETSTSETRVGDEPDSRTNTTQSPAPAWKRWQLALFIGATLLIWSSAFPAIKAAAKEYAPEHVALMRHIVSASVLALIAFLWKPVRLPDREDWSTLLLAGFTGVMAYHCALSYGQKTVTAGAASFITNTVPIFTALLAGFFLKEQLRWPLFVGMALSLSGALIIAVGENKSFGLNIGAAAVLLAALSQASYFIVQKKLLRKYTVFEVVCYSTWIGTAGLFLGSRGLLDEVVTGTTKGLLTVAYLGLFSGVISFLAWSKVISMMPASRATSFLFFVPLLATTISWFWHGEIPGGSTFTGGALALAGVILVNSSPTRA